MKRAFYILFLFLAMMVRPVSAQQLKLGNNPVFQRKSALLELESGNQGLLLTRIQDTSLVNALTPPDGTLIYSVSDQRLLIRAGNRWMTLVPMRQLSEYLSMNGNAAGIPIRVGTLDNYAVGLYAGGGERMTLLPNGNIGIGNPLPAARLQVRSGVSGISGLRLENLTSSASPTPASAAIGVDNAGNVVRTAAPVFYHGNADGVATVGTSLKVWTAEVSNTGTGIVTINIPSNIGFANILCVTVNAKGGTDLQDAPVTSLISTSPTTIVVRVLESRTTGILLGGSVEGLEPHTKTTTRLYIRVEGN